VLKSEKRVFKVLDDKIMTFKFLQKNTGLSRVGLLGALLRLCARGEVKTEFFGRMYVIQACTLPRQGNVWGE